MANKTFVLLEVEVDKTNDILMNLRKIPGLKDLDIVSGAYDIIATFDIRDIHTLLNVIVEKIHCIDGIRRAVSCISYQLHECGATFTGSTPGKAQVHKNVAVAVG